MSAAHTRAAAPAPASEAVPFAAFLARHDLPADGPLPPRAASLAVEAYLLTPRYVGHSEPLRAMAAARRECERRRESLLAQARAAVACEGTRA